MPRQALTPLELLFAVFFTFSFGFFLMDWFAAFIVLFIPLAAKEITWGYFFAAVWEKSGCWLWIAVPSFVLYLVAVYITERKHQRWGR